jgi:hypothetical protein
MFEATVMALEGHGATTIWQKDQPKQTVEWGRGSAFAPPINCYYRHYNLDGQKPTRLLAVTLAPMVINFFCSSEMPYQRGLRVFRSVQYPPHGSIPGNFASSPVTSAL